MCFLCLLLKGCFRCSPCLFQSPDPSLSFADSRRLNCFVLLQRFDFRVQLLLFFGPALSSSLRAASCFKLSQQTRFDPFNQPELFLLSLLLSLDLSDEPLFSLGPLACLLFSQATSFLAGANIGISFRDPIENFLFRLAQGIDLGS